MATDFAFELFFIPVALAVLVLIGIAVFARHRPVTPMSFLGLGRASVAGGYLGALLATVLLAAVEALRLTNQKVSLGHWSPEEWGARWWQTTLYFFVLFSPFVMACLTALGLPTIALLRRSRLTSLAALCIAAVGVAAFMSLWVRLWPYNPWCRARPGDCQAGTFLDALLVTVPIAAGFALGARLPLLPRRSMPERVRSDG